MPMDISEDLKRVSPSLCRADENGPAEQLVLCVGAVNIRDGLGREPNGQDRPLHENPGRKPGSKQWPHSHQDCVVMTGSLKNTSHSRVIIFAESGLLAGDLAAWLSTLFCVERVTSYQGAAQAVSRPAGALVVVEGRECGTLLQLEKLVRQARRSGCLVLILGMDPETAPPEWAGQVTHLKALPDPNELMRALGNFPPRASQARA